MRDEIERKLEASDEIGPEVGPEPKNQIKGKLALSQVYNNVKRFAKHRGGYGSVEIHIYFNPEHNNGGVNFKVWDSTRSMHYEPIGEHNDIRKIGALIDQIIKDDEEEPIR